ncbi:MAG TPA: hypothetical protein V6C81_10550 [Planktothrix sp.]|jgi:hypothetical protein
MNQNRRKFLQQLAAVCGSGVARSLGIGLGSAVAVTAVPRVATAAKAATAATLVRASYGPAVRTQVFEVIVRQGLAGAPWKEICAGPMQVNNITVSEVEAEIARRKTILDEETRRIDEIAHSAISPCACNECRLAIKETLARIRSEVSQKQEV